MIDMQRAVEPFAVEYKEKRGTQWFLDETKTTLKDAKARMLYLIYGDRLNKTYHEREYRVSFWIMEKTWRP